MFKVLLASFTQIYALTASLPHCPGNPGLQKNANLIVKAAMMGAVETRVPALSHPEWKSFRGTGIVSCPNGNDWKGSTIQLSGKSNLVTGVAHTLAPKCVLKSDAELAKCEVTFPLTGSDKIYRIKRNSLTTGVSNGGCFREHRKHDWSVFELTETVTGVDPYEIPPPGYFVPNPRIAGPIKIEQVAADASNLQTPPFKSSETRSDLESFNIQECLIMARDRFSNVSVQTNCHTGGGSSGAGQFTVQGNRRTMIAINSGQSDTSSREYDDDTHFNMSVPVEGEFLAELHRRMKP